MGKITLTTLSPHTPKNPLQTAGCGITPEKFQIIMPVFNERKLLERVLQHARTFNYLKCLVVVNDASTDGSTEILDRWSRDHGLTSLHLDVNNKKEGAIRKVLEFLEQGEGLNPYTVIIDADTKIQVSARGDTVENQIISAITYMNMNNLDAMAFRVNADYLDKPTASWFGAYATYFALQFDCWIYGLFNQLWVINGAAGLFRSEQLLHILQNMEPDFETGDLQITVDLMKMGSRIKLYNDITVLTFVPDTLISLFAQRRRWERGTLKVLWKERKFYIKQIFRKSFLPIGLILHLLLYVGIFLTTLGYIYRQLFFTEIIFILVASAILIWFTVDALKGTWVALQTQRNRLPLFLLSAVLNILVWLCIVMPARLFGMFDFVYQIIKRRWK